MDTTSSKQFASENLPPDIQLKADRMNLDPAQIPPYELPPLPLQPGMDGSHFQHMAAPRLIELFEPRKVPPSEHLASAGKLT